MGTHHLPVHDKTVYHIIRQTIPSTKDEASSRKAAIASADTSAVAGAAVAGVAIHDFNRIIDTASDEARTITAWNLAETTVEFRPDFPAETVTTGEVIRRMKDTAWQRANPDHPISYMAQAIEAFRRLVRSIKEKRPLVAFPRGRSTAYLVMGGDQANGRRLLQRAGFGDEEIEAICREVYGR